MDTPNHCPDCNCDHGAPSSGHVTDEQINLVVRMIEDRRSEGRADPTCREVSEAFGRHRATGGRWIQKAKARMDTPAAHPNDNFADLASADDRPMFGPWSS